ncbi:uncharacterized protein SAPINGB_P002307 [Magnusiomyces paraingens]|uniref:VHS domain-containing protein n=1 Tax=Magnusiomyces paraingens TaxID=2606893 RepID=A0A5E8BD88_9ASCO|nr:uncharacterized protein SAPINGB_P002307 [Saprochaete ingens]VVT49514.1 unnamed protein product [Saprochaete ingens]
MSRYSDSPSSAPSSSSASYTDRFRVDDHFPSDFEAAPVGAVEPRQHRSQPTESTLVTLIERACSPNLHEPNLSLNLEISDLINQKKGPYPRVAAVNIVRLINSKNSHVAILALSVLDICVKNCGYPFHLQISRKEFLNDLVKRFPEKPPIAYTRVQTLILQAIQEWWETICCTSKYKDDLGYIRDMHRLLNRKGYIFPEVSATEAAVLNPADTLQSASELEQEERDAQEAKLQELIRRGTPADLQEANRLMKVMAGFQDQKTNYRAKVAEEVDKVRRKAELLDEMLANLGTDTDVSNDDVITDIVASLKTSVPKIKSLIDEEHDDTEAVQKLLGLNDYMVSLLKKYSLARDSDFGAAQSVQIARPANVNITTSHPETSISLIDFGDDEDENKQTSTNSISTPLGSPKPGNNLDLLSQLNGLSVSSPPKQAPAPSNGYSNADLLASLASPSSPSTQSPQVTASPSQQSSGPNYDFLKSLSSPKSSLPGSPAIGSLSLLSSGTPPPTSSPAHADEWNFASATPTTITPVNPGTPFALLDDGTITVSGTVTRDSPTSVHAILTLSNKSLTTDLANVNLLLAVKRDLSIRLDPLSSTTLPRFASVGAQQHTYVGNVVPGAEVKLRWKITYTVNGGATVDRDGITSLPHV